MNKIQSDWELLAEKYDNIFAGHVEDDDEKDDKNEDSEDSKDSEDSEKDTKSEDSESTGDDSESNNDSEDSDSDGESKESEDSKDSGESEDSEESKESGDEETSEAPKGDKGVQSKIQALQKQYNDILADAFGKYAPDCIKSALDDSEGAFGENIETIVQGALDKLKAVVLKDFGIETAVSCPQCQQQSSGTGLDDVGKTVLTFGLPKLNEEYNRSILQDIIQQIYDTKDLEEAKRIALEHIQKSQIHPDSKRKMLIEIERMHSLPLLQKYLTNAMLKCMGMGVR